MKSVKMNRQQLLDIVRENKEKHDAEYIESVADYKLAALKICHDNLKLAKSGELEQIAKIKKLPPEPSSYSSNYTKAIRMLELSVDEVLEIDETVFNQLVLDEWSWKLGFLNNMSLYKGAL